MSVDSAWIARAEAAYLGLALGDALGATVEFLTPREIAHQYDVHRDIRGGGWLGLKPGQVTDDTTMSLALGAAILADGGEVHALSCARAFDAWMRGKPVDIGNTIRRNLIAFRRSGQPLAQAVTSVGTVFHIDGNLSQALDAALGSPSSVGVAVDREERVVGGILATDVLAAVEARRRV